MERRQVVSWSASDNCDGASASADGRGVQLEPEDTAVRQGAERGPRVIALVFLGQPARGSHALTPGWPSIFGGEEGLLPAG